MTVDNGASLQDRAFVPSASSPAVSPVPASIPSAADDLRLHHTAFRPADYRGKSRHLKSEYKELFATFVEPLWERIERLSAPDLWQLIEACQAVSPINCAWSDYAMAELLHDVATHDLANRLSAQAIDAQSAKTEGLGPKDESPVRQDAPDTSPLPTIGGPYAF